MHHYRIALVASAALILAACSEATPSKRAAPAAPTNGPPNGPPNGNGDAGTKPPDAGTVRDANPPPRPDAYATPPDGAGGSDGADGAVPPEEGCGLNTGYPGDEECILPPPPELGFQVHIGPSDYNNPEPDYLMQPGDERTTTFSAVAGNEQDAYFYYRQYRMRRTAHHVILETPNGTGLNTGRRIGTANTSQDFPAGGVIAPEDRGVGMPITARSPINVSLHAINATQAPALREVWVNFWYKNPTEVTEPAIPWFETGAAQGGVSFAVPPRASQKLGPYSCTVQGDGRLLWLYGHRHANNVRFNVVRVRGTQRDVIYDAFHWEETLLLEYNSLVQNRVPDPAQKIEGGWSGILDLRTGDRIEWFCDVVNQTDSTLRFTNNTFTGEMCIVDAEAVGSSCG